MLELAYMCRIVGPPKAEHSSSHVAIGVRTDSDDFALAEGGRNRPSAISSTSPLGRLFRLGFSAATASVVTINPATLAAF
jgi:hypothetical protein